MEDMQSNPSSQGPDLPNNHGEVLLSLVFTICNPSCGQLFSLECAESAKIINRLASNSSKQEGALVYLKLAS